METLLRYEHVDIAYLGQPAVEDVSFSLSSGEILGIVGESGSGKSTLIKAAMGLLGSEGRVTGGSIRYKGRDLTALPQKELRKLCGPELGYIFQSAGSAFCPIRTVGAQLYEAMREHGKISKALFDERALEMLTKLGFTVEKSVKLNTDNETPDTVQGASLEEGASYEKGTTVFLFVWGEPETTEPVTEDTTADEEFPTDESSVSEAIDRIINFGRGN